MCLCPCRRSEGKQQSGRVAMRPSGNWMSRCTFQAGLKRGLFLFPGGLNRKWLLFHHMAPVHGDRLDYFPLQIQKNSLKVVENQLFFSIRALNAVTHSQVNRRELSDAASSQKFHPQHSLTCARMFVFIRAALPRTCPVLMF